MALLSRFFGRTVSEGAAFAFGAAASPVLLPAVEKIRQEAWGTYPDRVPDAMTLAMGVAQGQVDPQQAQDWATANGYGPTVFGAMVNVANVGMPLGSAMEAWRRGQLTDDQFRTQLKRAAIEEEWDAAMEALKQALLEPAEIAKAIHRNIMRGEGLLLVEPSTVPGKVPIVPQSDIDPLTEAAGSGLDKERLRILVGNAGLPPGVVQGLELLNRGAITEDDFSRLVGESNMRQEWGDALLALRRRLLTPHEYEEAALRGVISNAEADAGAALSGMEPTDAQLLFQIMGRPLAVHQITTGLARGGQYGGTYDDIPEPYRDAVRRSNIRPEYARLAYANRYSLPSFFVVRAMIQSKALTEQEGADLFKQEGWPPDLADKAAASYATSSTSSTSSLTSKADTQLWTATHSSYVKQEIAESTARANLAALGASTADQDAILSRWNTERAMVHAQLSPADIRKAMDKGVPNPATGQPWSMADATQALLDRGYDQADAQTYLATPIGS